MSTNYALVIVESPAKTRKIEQYLDKLYGKGKFKVLASMGHIRDLPPDKIGVDVDHNFKPHYVISKGKGKTVATLRKHIKVASALYLAADPDREGEAIAWHLVETLRPKCPVHRVTFNAITQEAIHQAFEHPGVIDMNLVKAQESRRIIDRLVGYSVSPLLWKALNGKGLSAGRVQSVALRMVVERQREIDRFKPQDYYAIEGQFQAQGGVVTAKLYTWQGKRWSASMFTSAGAAQAVVDTLCKQAFTLSALEQKPVAKRPPAPFTTSTLQQAAAKHLDLAPDKTMQVAQKLYEAGHITYMRTDSPAVSPPAQAAAHEQILEHFGQAYVPEKPPVYKSKGDAQEAHECIRPSHIEQAKLDQEDDIPAQLYHLIWQRFIASQMAPARYDRTVVTIQGGDATFRASGNVLTFAGFLQLYDYPEDEEQTEDDDQAGNIPPLVQGESLAVQQLKSIHRVTKPPALFNQASLVKELERNGVGRPSTFASMVATIRDKGYVKLQKKKLVPTPTGIQILDYLLQHFPEFFDVGFTSEMESRLDVLATGKGSFKAVVHRFWEQFNPLLADATHSTQPSRPQAEETDLQCPVCGAMLLIRTGKNGQFYSCSAFPSCRYSRSLDMPDPDVLGDCPECDDGKLVIKTSRKGSHFVACLNYPACRYSRNLTPDEKELV